MGRKKQFVSAIIALAFVLSVPSVTATASEASAVTAIQHYIEWPFITYTEPDFTAKIHDTFNPQTVTVLESREDGWALISTYSGISWAYINGNSRYIDKRMGLFDNMGDITPITTIASQVVSIIGQDGDWLQISTWLGSKWINLKYTPPSTELESFMKQYGNSVSVYYENLETGYVYRHNADKAYFAASVIKAPYCLYIYHLAENGLADLSAQHTYSSRNYIGGSGTIKNMKTGTIFTESELLAHTIRKSDNVATKMLIDLYGVSGFKSFVSELGGNSSHINNILYTNPGALMTANEAGFYMKAIYNYIEGGHTYSNQFKADLMNTTNPMIVSDYPIARKYGWAKNSFHDMAIVYADSPYIIAIMSARESGNAKDFAAFRDISMAVQEFNCKYFAE